MAGEQSEGFYSRRKTEARADEAQLKGRTNTRRNKQLTATALSCVSDRKNEEQALHTTAMEP